jgi:hypothetical protein
MYIPEDFPVTIPPEMSKLLKETYGEKTAPVFEHVLNFLYSAIHMGVDPEGIRRTVNHMIDFAITQHELGKTEMS